MARQVAEENLEAIVDAVHQREVATAQEIARSLTEHIPLRTLQHRLNRLVAAGRLCTPIEECFDQILATTAAIEDPFEQAFFFMVQSPYLQPFDDVNKRVSRLAANIPLIKANLSPLTFIDVPGSTYTDAMLGVYELNKIDLMKDVFIWAYGRSAARYAATRQSLGEPDPFRLRHRAAIGEVVGQVVRERMNKKAALARLNSWT